jgi:hypothetical protein
MRNALVRARVPEKSWEGNVVREASRFALPAPLRNPGPDQRIPHRIP